MRFLLAVIAVISALAAPAMAGADAVTVVVNHAPPYRIVKRQSGQFEISGKYVDFAREMARRAALTLEFKVVPFQRALKMMEEGRAALMLGPNRTAEREH